MFLLKIIDFVRLESPFSVGESEKNHQRVLESPKPPTSPSLTKKPPMTQMPGIHLTVVFHSTPWALISGFLTFLSGHHWLMCNRGVAIVQWCTRVWGGGTRVWWVRDMVRTLVVHRGTGPGVSPALIPTVSPLWLYRSPLCPHCTAAVTHCVSTESPLCLH